MDGVAAARRVPDADRRARLHRHAGDPLHPRVEPHHVRGARERRGPRPRRRHLAVDAHVRRRAVVEDRRAGRGGGAGSPSPRAAAPSRRRRARRRRAPPRASRRRPWPPPRPRSAHGRRASADAGRGRTRRPGRTISSWGLPGIGLCVSGLTPSAAASSPVSTATTPGVARAAAVSMRPDARVRVRRAHEARVGLAGQVDVVAVAAAAHEQARVVHAEDRLADAFARRRGPGLEERHGAASLRQGARASDYTRDISRCPQRVPGPAAAPFAASAAGGSDCNGRLDSRRAPVASIAPRSATCAGPRSRGTRRRSRKNPSREGVLGPVRWERTVTVIGCHVGGEENDVIVGGVLPPPGATMFEKKRYLETHGDELRRWLLLEPRGKPTLCVNLVTPPTRPDCDAGLIIMESADYPPMSGSNTICTVTVLLETGMLPMREPVTIPHPGHARGPGARGGDVPGRQGGAGAAHERPVLRRPPRRRGRGGGPGRDPRRRGVRRGLLCDRRRAVARVRGRAPRGARSRRPRQPHHGRRRATDPRATPGQSRTSTA